VERPAKDAVKSSGKGNMLETGQMPTGADLRAVSMEQCDQAMTHFLVASKVGKFLPK
jgi:hypothetical protein